MQAPEILDEGPEGIGLSRFSGSSYKLTGRTVRTVSWFSRCPLGADVTADVGERRGGRRKMLEGGQVVEQEWLASVVVPPVMARGRVGKQCWRA